MGFDKSLPMSRELRVNDLFWWPGPSLGSVTLPIPCARPDTRYKISYQDIFSKPCGKMKRAVLLKNKFLQQPGGCGMPSEGLHGFRVGP